MNRSDLLLAVIKTPNHNMANVKSIANYFLTFAKKPLEKAWIVYLWVIMKYSEKTETRYPEDL